MSIKIDLKIFLFILLFIITNQIEIYALVMFFAIIHELGHLLAGVSLGFKPKSINIIPFGLQIEFKVHFEDYNKKIKKGNELCLKRAIIAIAGPLTNLFIILICILCQIPNSENVIYANILIGIFNLIPIYPLDGGRIIKEILNIFLGLKNSYTYIKLISNITVIILTVVVSITVLYIQNIALVLIVLYLWYLVIRENRIMENRAKLYEGLLKE